ncbi:hypothetical protein KSP39_PZI002736 [Platanthera zijinensis]|uniref:Uncharacterized protein n=1 Tax=Platanthera zijinensis TaxID=2320716 RepID=A0AAP0GEL2_9ASPA
MNPVFTIRYPNSSSETIQSSPFLPLLASCQILGGAINQDDDGIATNIHLSVLEEVVSHHTEGGRNYICAAQVCEQNMKLKFLPFPSLTELLNTIKGPKGTFPIPYLKLLSPPTVLLQKPSGATIGNGFPSICTPPAREQGLPFLVFLATISTLGFAGFRLSGGRAAARRWPPPQRRWWWRWLAREEAGWPAAASARPAIVFVILRRLDLWGHVDGSEPALPPPTASHADDSSTVNIAASVQRSHMAKWCSDKSHAIAIFC